MFSFQRGLLVAAAVSMLGAMSLWCAAEDAPKKDTDAVSWEKLPKAVQEGIEKVILEHLLRGDTVKVDAFEDKGNGIYEVEAVIDGKDSDFFVDSSGKFAGIEGPEDEDEEGRGVTAYLGISAGQGDSDGVVVGAVMAESPAARAGISGEDVIESLGGMRIKGSGKGALEQLISELGKYKPGDKVKVVVRRNGKSKELSVMLAARPTGDDDDEDGDDDDEDGDDDDEDGDED